MEGEESHNSSGRFFTECTFCCRRFSLHCLSIRDVQQSSRWATEKRKSVRDFQGASGISQDSDQSQCSLVCQLREAYVREGHRGQSGLQLAIHLHCERL